MMFSKALCFFFLLFFYSNLLAKDGSAIALIYHRFENNLYPSTSISQKNFYEQLQYLKENNFNVLPITTLIDFFTMKNLYLKKQFLLQLTTHIEVFTNMHFQF